MTTRLRIMALLVLLTTGLMLNQVVAQDAGDTEPATVTATDTGEEDAEDSEPKSASFLQVVLASGVLGVLIWLALIACSAMAMTLAIDSFMRIRENKISPMELVEAIQKAMSVGDILKATKACEEYPGSLANILSTGFNNIQEGFDIIQDAVSVAADIETERLMQKVFYLNVIAAVAPMLGLLGTVQGMINAFGTLAGTAAGAAQQAMLALNISQALWTTAAGLVIALPALTIFTVLRNKATKIILSMEALTLDMIKGLKNVEVVEE